MQLAELVEVEGPERAVHRRREHPQHDDDEQDVEGRAELDDERHSGGEQEGDERDPVVDEQQPDDLGDGLSAGDEQEEAEQHRRQPDRREVGRACRAASAVSFPLARKATTMSAAAATSEAETLTNGAVSRLPGSRRDELSEQRRDDDALGDKDEPRRRRRARRRARARRARRRRRRARSLGATSAETIARRSRRHSVITPQTSTAPAARSSAST